MKNSNLLDIRLFILISLIIVSFWGCGPKSGVLEIRSIPENADVYIDGTSAGQTTEGPLVIEELSAEWHVVKVEKAGYLAMEDSVLIYGNKTSSMIFELPPPQNTVTLQPSKDKQSPTGIISVKSEPEGAAVLLNGVYTNYQTPVKLFQVKPGEHTISISKKGFYTTKKNVDVVAGKTSRITLKMEAEEKAAEVIDEPEEIPVVKEKPETRSIASAQAVTQARHKMLESCFKRQQRMYNVLQGKVTFTFTILNDGSVKNIQVKNHTWNNEKIGKEVETCLRSIIARLPFEEVKRGEINMELPLIFK